MYVRRLLSVAALLVAGSASVFAQTTPQTRPAAPAATPPVVTAPAKPATTTPATTAAVPVVKKVNLNTATVAELDGLPQIGPARAKAIVEARAKSPFKNWDDFAARNVVPTNAETAIKNLVSF